MDSEQLRPESPPSNASQNNSNSSPVLRKRTETPPNFAATSRQSTKDDDSTTPDNSRETDPKIAEKGYFKKPGRLDSRRGSISDDEEDTEEGELDEPPLPPGPPPANDPANDGWQPVWDGTYSAYYFYNSLTGATTWTNPRVPDAAPIASTVDPPRLRDTSAGSEPDSLHYNPAIHGDYDPSAAYAQARDDPDAGETAQYESVAAFNRFTGKFQPSSSQQVPENYNDENKSRRQMQFYFDVDAAANSHDGRSLKAERQTKKLSKQELKQYKEKRKQRKEEKRKAWLRD